MNKRELYAQAINLLKCIELVVKDKEQYKVLRKQVLDLANNIIRSDEDGK